MNRNRLESYRDFARPYYSAKDPGHDFRHIERIIARLERFSEGLNPPPQPHRLYFLSCFHGLGQYIKDNSQTRDEVRCFLEGLSWKGDEIEEMFQSLLRHLKNPVTVEEMIVCDANSLEVLGAFGIAKAFITGGTRGQTYEETADIFQDNLNKISFWTPAGKRLAVEGKRYAIEFLARLCKEW